MSLSIRGYVKFPRSCQLRGSSGGHGPLIADAMAKGYKRLSPERRAAVIEARRLNPGGRQAALST